MPNVSVPSAWFERLRELAKSLDDYAGPDQRSKISHLLGYIESSEAFGEGEDSSEGTIKYDMYYDMYGNPRFPKQ